MVGKERIGLVRNTPIRRAILVRIYPNLLVTLRWKRQRRGRIVGWNPIIRPVAIGRTKQAHCSCSSIDLREADLHSVSRYGNSQTRAFVVNLKINIFRAASVQIWNLNTNEVIFEVTQGEIHELAVKEHGRLPTGWVPGNLHGWCARSVGCNDSCRP